MAMTELMGHQIDAATIGEAIAETWPYSNVATP